jgi:hypothetical protein
MHVSDQVPHEVNLRNIANLLGRVAKNAYITSNEDALEKIRKLMGNVLETRGARNYVNAPYEDWKAIGTIDDIKVKSCIRWIQFTSEIYIE